MFTGFIDLNLKNTGLDPDSGLAFATEYVCLGRVTFSPCKSVSYLDIPDLQKSSQV